MDVTRATVIAADPFDTDDVAEAWLAQAGGGVGAALAILNRALHAQRIASADAYAVEVALRDALVTRVGYGTGEQVADGRWTAARELPPERPRIAREAALRPQERFAALLSGRDAALACELLALRARLDLEQGRDREAALQLEAALGAGLAELEGWRELDGMAERLEELAGFADAVGAAAHAARRGLAGVVVPTSSARWGGSRRRCGRGRPGRISRPGTSTAALRGWVRGAAARRVLGRDCAL